MPLYAVTYAHPDEAGWAEHVMAHVRYLRDLLKDGTLRASGPLPGAAVKSALLILSAPDQITLLDIIARDPFAIHGLIHDMTISEWDPIFGVFNADSSMPGQLQG